MSRRDYPYPFTAIVGQEDMKTALILNMIDPKIGGVLAFGEKGTAKSTAVRAIVNLLPKIAVVDGCRFRCDPGQPDNLCEECRARKERGEDLPVKMVPMRVAELPVSATEDRVVGTLDLEEAISHGKRHFEAGLLASANRGILYVDEINLLDDHIVDLLLDSAAMGVNHVERESISFTHPAQFVLVGTMNPEEGELRPQLLDRFGLSVRIGGIGDIESRVRIMKYRSLYDADEKTFCASFAEREAALREKIRIARERLPKVQYRDEVLEKIAEIAIALEVDGHRSDLTLLKAARAFAAFEGRTEIEDDDLKRMAPLVFMHRMRTLPFEQGRTFDMTLVEEVLS